MSYFMTYRGIFPNKQGNEIKIEVSRKDIDPGDVVDFSNLEMLGVKVSYPNSEESKYSTIISAQADIDLRVRDSSVFNTETFLTDLFDEWKLIIYCDSVIVFAGFIEPSEGGYLMKDTPVNINIKCTDGLGLLKSIALTNYLGTSFQNTIQSLLDYVAGALAKTNLDLNILIFCSIYESSFSDRSVSTLFDMFNQAKTDYRTFMKNPTEFVDCYDALNIMLTGGFSLFQWKGKWVISYRPEMQGSIGPTNYFTEYRFDTSTVTSGQDLSTQINIGFGLQQHPINLDQIISYQVPMVFVKDKFDYNVWDEIPKNNKFDRGAINFIFSGVDYRGYDIDDWTFGVNTGTGTLPAVGPPTGNAFRKSTYNIFNIETSREILIDTASNSDQDWLQSEGIPVQQGDKISIGVDHKTSFSGTGNHIAFYVYIQTTSGSPAKYALQEDGTWSTLFGGLIHNYAAGENTDTYLSYNIDSDFLPQDGTLYIAFHNAKTFASTYYYKNFSFTYSPYIAGSLFQVKGDYWITTQNRIIKDNIDEELRLSDALKKVFKGALLRADGTTLTTPTWYRFGITESRHYKELLNWGKYRHYYRRYRKISGSFRGVKCYSESDLVNFYPLCFHKHFKFVNNHAGKLYALCPPVSIDYKEGKFTGTFIECFDSLLLTTIGTIGNVVQILVDQLQALIAPFIGPPPGFAFTDSGSGGVTWTFTITGTIQEGDYFKLVMYINDGVTFFTTIAEYTALASDTADDVAAGLYADVDPTYQTSQTTNQFIITTPADSEVVSAQVTDAFVVQALVGDLSGDPNFFRVYCGPLDTVTVDTNANGAGNSPTITEISNDLITATQRLYIFEVGSDVLPLNIFRVHLHISGGSTLTSAYTVTIDTEFTDSSQLGDTHEFKYIFQ